MLETLIHPADAFDALTLLLRLTLAIVIVPHGAQKRLGRFGGYGYRATLGYFTETLRFPAALGVTAIMTEFVAPFALAAGLLTRPAALAVLILMGVATVTTHLKNGFFMNWSGTNSREGFEYHILAAGIALTLILTGAGGWSLDRLLVNHL